MDIKTKFNIGNKVFFMHQNKVASANIEAIDIQVKKEMVTNKPNPYGYDIIDNPYIFYKMEGFSLSLLESALFSSKQELIESL